MNLSSDLVDKMIDVSADIRIATMQRYNALGCTHVEARRKLTLNEGTDCPKCQTQMVTGFIPDSTYGGFSLPGWYPGDPAKSWLGTYKVDTKQLIPIRTFRCPNCGYIESYAKWAKRSP